MVIYLLLRHDSRFNSHSLRYVVRSLPHTTTVFLKFVHCKHSHRYPLTEFASLLHTPWFAHVMFSQGSEEKWSKNGLVLVSKRNFKRDVQVLLRGNFFLCRIFVIKSVQNPKCFWHSSQNCFVLALFSSLFS